MIGSSLVLGRLRFRICRSIGGITIFVVMAVAIGIKEIARGTKEEQDKS